MVLLRHFVLCTLKYNILFHAKHIAGCINRKSDALFRLQVEKFRLLAPSADPQLTPVPGAYYPTTGTSLDRASALNHYEGFT